MKLYIDHRNKTTESELGYTLYDKKGSIISSDVLLTVKEENKHVITIKTLIFTLSRIKQLVEHRKIPYDNINIFTRNSIMYKWFEKGYSPKDHLVLFDEVMHLLDWFPMQIELIHQKSITGKVSYTKPVVDGKTYSIADFL